MTADSQSLMPQPMVKILYSDHLAAEGIEPFYMESERRAIAFGATTMLVITMKTVLSALQEAAGR